MKNRGQVRFGIVMMMVAMALLVSCNNSQKKKTEKKSCDGVHWSHHAGEDGPANWKNLCDGFTDCGGSAQSPIDIASENAVIGEKLVAPEFKYGNSKVDIINNGHTVQFNVDKGSAVNLNGKAYQLLQFHYHALSEHTINGKHAPLEVHFVHKHSDTDFAVLGIMIVEGAKNELFEKYLNQFPVKKGVYKSDDLIDLFGLFPANKSYYYYSGSLTTPPCSEVVSWYVLKNPVEASAEQIAKFSKILHDNYRPVMPLNNRKVSIFNE